MSNSQIDGERRERRVGIYLPADAVAALGARLAPGQTLNELAEALLGDDAALAQTVDNLHQRRMALAPVVRCSCCPRTCRFSWVWRNQRRCGCTAERIANVDADRAHA